MKGHRLQAKSASVRPHLGNLLAPFLDGGVDVQTPGTFCFIFSPCFCTRGRLGRVQAGITAPSALKLHAARINVAHCIWSTQETLDVPLIEVQFESACAVGKSFPSISHLLYFFSLPSQQPAGGK